MKGSVTFFIQGDFRWDNGKLIDFDDRQRNLGEEAQILARYLSKGWLVIPWPLLKRNSASFQDDLTSIWPCRKTINPPTYHKIICIETSSFLAKSERIDIDDVNYTVESQFCNMTPLQYLCAKDDYTWEHSMRVGRITSNMVNLFDALFTFAEINALRLCGYLHDFGKLNAPDILLSKPSSLSPREMYWVNRHQLVGLGLVSILSDASPYLKTLPILCHHLRPYQVELVGRDFFQEEKIHDVEGRYAKFVVGTTILKLADALDCLLSSRSYQKRKTPREAIDILLKDIKITERVSNHHAFPLVPLIGKNIYFPIIENWLNSAKTIIFLNDLLRTFPSPPPD
ncbi:MAG: hypothetical protein P9M14_15205 [Candidatus Alcyoniella australis]|nr:hypothetical protein [Candidatus Alcyoniella australis]